jgi:hypothetical protein
MICQMSANGGQPNEQKVNGNQWSPKYSVLENVYSLYTFYEYAIAVNIRSVNHHCGGDKTFGGQLLPSCKSLGFSFLHCRANCDLRMNPNRQKPKKQHLGKRDL